MKFKLQKDYQMVSDSAGDKNITKSCPSLRSTIGAPQPAYLPHRNCAASCPGPADILTQRRQLPLPLPYLNTPCICRWLRRPGRWPGAEAATPLSPLFLRLLALLFNLDFAS